MAYMPPTIDDFRARFPEFDDVTYPDSVVELVLAEATAEVDSTWNETDAWNATLYLTAHLLKTEAMMGGGASGGAGGGFLTTERVGPIHYSYDTKEMIVTAMGNYGLTIYGQRYYTLLKRNAGGPLLV